MFPKNGRVHLLDADGSLVIALEQAAKLAKGLGNLDLSFARHGSGRF
jgi:hypothetical protein